MTRHNRPPQPRPRRRAAAALAVALSAPLWVLAAPRPAAAAPPPTPALWATGGSVGSSVSPRFYVLQATFALYPAGTTARVYHEEGCGGAVRETLSVPTDLTAVAVAVPPGATTTLSVRVVNGEGGVSACSASSVYTHVVVEDTPRILFTSPESGAGDDAGSVKAYVFVPRYDSATTVSLYKSGDCSGAVAASGTHSASGYASAVSFAPGGVSRVTLSARVSGPSAGTSACSAPFEYVNDVGKPVVSGLTEEVLGPDTVRWTWQMSDDVSSVGALRPRIRTMRPELAQAGMASFDARLGWLELPPGTTEWTAQGLGVGIGYYASGEAVGAAVTVSDEAGKVSDQAWVSGGGGSGWPSGHVTSPSQPLASWHFGGGHFLVSVAPGATSAETPPQALKYSFCVSETPADLGCRPGVDLEVGDSEASDRYRCRDQWDGGRYAYVPASPSWRDVAAVTGLPAGEWPRALSLRTSVSGAPVYVRLVTHSAHDSAHDASQWRCRVSDVFVLTQSAAPVPRYPRLIVGSDWDHSSVVGSSLTPYVTPQDNFSVEHFTNPLYSIGEYESATGSAWVAPGRVDVYATPDCTGPVVGTGAGRGGANVPVLPGSTTTFSARAVGAAGGVSACSNVVTYTHDNAPPTVGGPTLEPFVSTDVDTGAVYMGHLGSWTLTDPNSTLAEMGEVYAWSRCTAAQVTTGCGDWAQVPAGSRLSAGYPTGGATRMTTHSLASREAVRLVDGVLVPASNGGPYGEVYTRVCFHVGMAGDKYHNETTTPASVCSDDAPPPAEGLVFPAYWSDYPAGHPERPAGAGPVERASEDFFEMRVFVLDEADAARSGVGLRVSLEAEDGHASPNAAAVGALDLTCVANDGGSSGCVSDADGAVRVRYSMPYRGDGAESWDVLRVWEDLDGDNTYTEGADSAAEVHLHWSERVCAACSGEGGSCPVGGEPAERHDDVRGGLQQPSGSFAPVGLDL